MSGRQTDRSIGAEGIFTANQTVACDNFFIGFVPSDQLLVARFARIVLIKIQCHARSTTSSSKCDFSESTNFSNYIGGIVVVNQINKIIPVIGVTKKTFMCKFSLEKLPIYWRNKFSSLSHSIFQVHTLSISSHPPTRRQICCCQNSCRKLAFQA